MTLRHSVLSPLSSFQIEKEGHGDIARFSTLHTWVVLVEEEMARSCLPSTFITTSAGKSNRAESAQPQGKHLLLLGCPKVQLMHLLLVHGSLGWRNGVSSQPVLATCLVFCCKLKSEGRHGNLGRAWMLCHRKGTDMGAREENERTQVWLGDDGERQHADAKQRLGRISHY